MRMLLQVYRSVNDVHKYQVLYMCPLNYLCGCKISHKLLLMGATVLVCYTHASGDELFFSINENAIDTIKKTFCLFLLSRYRTAQAPPTNQEGRCGWLSSTKRAAGQILQPGTGDPC